MREMVRNLRFLSSFSIMYFSIEGFGNALYCKGDSLLDEEEKLLHGCFSLN